MYVLYLHRTSIREQVLDNVRCQNLLSFVRFILFGIFTLGVVAFSYGVRGCVCVCVSAHYLRKCYVCIMENEDGKCEGTRGRNENNILKITNNSHHSTASLKESLPPLKLSNIKHASLFLLKYSV